MSDASKFTMIDAAHHNGKHACLAADSFVVSKNALQDTVNGHTETIGLMRTSLHHLEQQVKDMTRIMASQNLTRMTENLKLAQEDLRRQLVFQITEKQKDILEQVEREVADVSDTKIGILKRIDQVESHIMTTVNQRLDEAAADRLATRNDLDKIKATLDDLPTVAEKTQTVVKNMEAKLSDMKIEFRKYVSEHEHANREQDKQTNSLTAEVRTKLQAATDKIGEETKALTKLIKKHEEILNEEMKDVRVAVDQECNARNDQFKTIGMQVKEEVDRVRAEAEKRIKMIENSVDHKVRPSLTAIKEMRHAIDEEAVYRDTADKELARRISKEIQERHHDEERLVSLITTCQAAVSKFSK